MAFKIRRTKAGLRVGAASDKIGFLGTVPVAKPAHADQAVAEDAPGALRLANRLRTDLIALGLIKGSALLAIFLGIALLAMVTTPVQASVQTDNVGMATTVAADTTITSGLGNAVNVSNAEHVMLFLTFKAADAGTSNIVLTLARSPTGVYYETTPQIAVTVAANGTNTVRFATNLTSSVVGACGYLKAVSLANGQTNALSNVDLQIVQKRIR